MKGSGEEDFITQQRQYALSADLSTPGIIVPGAFVRGIRHLGYKTNLEAISELIDNSIQAYAEGIDVIFGYDPDVSIKKPSCLAIIDDGHGMPPDMMRLAIMWGGTHRENDRAGLGRFGYGLPCATLTIGRKFTVYSKTKRGRLHSISLDLDQIIDWDFSKNGPVAVPSAQPTRLPKFLSEGLEQSHPQGWNSGTIVVIEKLDRLDWSTAIGIKRNLVRHLGVSYHKLLSTTRIAVDGHRVRPIDPLFLSHDAEFYDLDEDRAVPLDPVTLKIPGNQGEIGEVTMRYAWLPKSFASTDKSREATGANANSRFAIMKQYHGILFSRNGRLIDVQSRTPWTIFLNNDRYIRIEVEFSAALDEDFGITTSKQQISVCPQMWDYLRVGGLQKAIEHLRAKVRTSKAKRNAPSVSDAIASYSGELALVKRNPSKVPLGVDQGEALALLLDEIESRSAEATPQAREIYQTLLNGWYARLNSGPSPRVRR